MMNFHFTGKNLVVSTDMKEKTEKKAGRLSRLFDGNVDVYVAFSAVKQENKVEISIPFANKRMLRAEVSSVDMLAAIDSAVDALDKQIVKHKKRAKDKARRDKSYNFQDEFKLLNLVDDNDASEDEIKIDGIVIERRKHFPLKPMDPEEACMSMEMLGHNFYVFRNSSTDEINVVYKRNSGDYGLIDPNDPIDE